MKVLTICDNPDYPGCLQLQRSLKHFGWEYHIEVVPFQFGRQMKTIYEWAKKNWGWFCYVDAYDNFALAGPDELAEKLKDFTGQMLISAEKACYPEASLAPKYPHCETEWKYVNAGGFLTTCEQFVKMYEDGSHHEESNDQTWLSEQFLKREEVHLDYACKIFQTIAFEGENDLSVVAGPRLKPVRLLNNQTGQKPIIFHGNGGTNMGKIWGLL